MKKAQKSKESKPNEVRGLSAFQLRIAELLLQSCGPREIAVKLRRSATTIYGQLHYMYKKAARRAVVALISEINTDGRLANSNTVTVGQLCDHFVQRELSKENSWRSHATKKIYQAYLSRWIRPHWQKYELAAIRTIQVESWLRTLPLAKSSCAKIRNLMSVLFNHACRYELFDRNPIYLVRQSAKRRTAPVVLAPAEIKLLISSLIGTGPARF